MTLVVYCDRCGRKKPLSGDPREIDLMLDGEERCACEPELSPVPIGVGESVVMLPIQHVPLAGGLYDNESRPTARAMPRALGFFAAAAAFAAPAVYERRPVFDPPGKQHRASPSKRAKRKSEKKARRRNRR